MSSGFRVVPFASRKRRFGNAGSVPIVPLPLARSGAIQVVLLGLASSPAVGGVVGCVGGGGGGVVGGGSCPDGGGVLPPPSPPQPAISKVKQIDNQVACLARGMVAPLVLVGLTRESVLLRASHAVVPHTRCECFCLPSAAIALCNRSRQRKISCTGNTFKNGLHFATGCFGLL